MKTMKVAALLIQSTGFIRWDLPPPRTSLERVILLGSERPHTRIQRSCQRQDAERHLSLHDASWHYGAVFHYLKASSIWPR
jgi:hypothetical protein